MHSTVHVSLQLRLVRLILSLVWITLLLVLRFENPWLHLNEPQNKKKTIKTTIGGKKQNCTKNSFLANETRIRLRVTLNNRLRQMKQYKGV